MGLRPSLQGVARGAGVTAALSGLAGVLSMLGAFGPVYCRTGRMASSDGTRAVSRACGSGIDYLLGSGGGNAATFFAWAMVLLAVVVVAGAATAFGGWTVLEILLGNALKGALPEVYLDGITAGLFIVFAAWILYTPAFDLDSEPEPTSITDGGPAIAAEAADAVPSRFAGFVPSFSLMVFGEFGDKTQLITIGLAVQYGAHPAIWFGEMLAIIPVSIANAYLFHRFSHRFDARLAHFVGAGLYLFFGLDTVLQVFTGFSVWETIVNGLSSLILGFI